MCACKLYKLLLLALPECFGRLALVLCTYLCLPFERPLASHVGLVSLWFVVIVKREETRCDGGSPQIGWMYKRVNRSEESPERHRGKKVRRKNFTSKPWSRTRSLTPNHLAGSHALSQSCNAGCFECLATASTHAKSTPATTPVLILIVSMADCALDRSVLIARR